jgi:hypothetical protein
MFSPADISPNHTGYLSVGTYTIISGNHQPSHLALEHRRAGDSVRVEVVVDLSPQLCQPTARFHQFTLSPPGTTHVRSISRVARLEGAWDLDRRAGVGAAAAGDADLRAADVELRHAARVVDGQLLDA